MDPPEGYQHEKNGQKARLEEWKTGRRRRNSKRDREEIDGTPGAGDRWRSQPGVIEHEENEPRVPCTRDSWMTVRDWRRPRENWHCQRGEDWVCGRHNHVGSDDLQQLGNLVQGSGASRTSCGSQRREFPGGPRDEARRETRAGRIRASQVGTNEEGREGCEAVLDLRALSGRTV